MRGKQTFMAGAAVLCVGLFYGYVLIPMGIRVRCPLRLATGLRCPGCGITDLCLGILHGRFEPWHNWGLVLVSPVLLWLPCAQWQGNRQRAVQATSWGVFVFLMLWAVFRNFGGI